MENIEQTIKRADRGSVSAEITRTYTDGDKPAIVFRAFEHARPVGGYNLDMNTRRLDDFVSSLPRFRLPDVQILSIGAIKPIKGWEDLKIFNVNLSELAVRVDEDWKSKPAAKLLGEIFEIQGDIEVALGRFEFVLKEGVYDRLKVLANLINAGIQEINRLTGGVHLSP